MHEGRRGLRDSRCSRQPLCGLRPVPRHDCRCASISARQTSCGCGSGRRMPRFKRAVRSQGVLIFITTSTIISSGRVPKKDRHVEGNRRLPLNLVHQAPGTQLRRIVASKVSLIQRLDQTKHTSKASELQACLSLWAETRCRFTTRRAYSDAPAASMPTVAVAGYNIGLSPLLQWIFVHLTVFWAVARWHSTQRLVRRTKA